MSCAVCPCVVSLCAADGVLMVVKTPGESWKAFVPLVYLASYRRGSIWHMFCATTTRRARAPRSGTTTTTTPYRSTSPSSMPACAREVHREADTPIRGGPLHHGPRAQLRARVADPPQPGGPAQLLPAGRHRLPHHRRRWRTPPPLPRSNLPKLHSFVCVVCACAVVRVSCVRWCSARKG